MSFGFLDDFTGTAGPGGALAAHTPNTPGPSGQKFLPSGVSAENLASSYLYVDGTVGTSYFNLDSILGAYPWPLGVLLTQIRPYSTAAGAGASLPATTVLFSFAFTSAGGSVYFAIEQHTSAWSRSIGVQDPHTGQTYTTGNYGAGIFIVISSDHDAGNAEGIGNSTAIGQILDAAPWTVQMDVTANLRTSITVNGALIAQTTEMGSQLYSSPGQVQMALAKGMGINAIGPAATVIAFTATTSDALGAGDSSNGVAGGIVPPVPTPPALETHRPIPKPVLSLPRIIDVADSFNIKT